MHIGGAVGEQCRGDVVAVEFGTFTADDKGGAGVGAALDERLDTITVKFGDDRPDDRAIGVGIADRHESGERLEGLDQLVVDVLVRDHAGRRRADLTTVEAPHGGDRLSGDADVGILGDDRGTLAAEFHESRFMVLPPFSMIFAPTPVEPVNEIMSTFLGVDERRRNLRTGTVHDVDHAGREAGGVDRLTEQEDAERILRRRLDDGGAAGGERRRNLAGHVGDREVVGVMQATTPTG